MLLVLICLIVFTNVCHAELNSDGVLDTVYKTYKSEARKWEAALISVATYIFITLSTISMVWIFAQLLFHRSSFAEFFGEFIRFLVTTGLFFWFLKYGSTIAMDIVQSFQEIALDASGYNSVTPSAIVDIGFEILTKVSTNIVIIPFLFDTGSLMSIFVALIVLIVLALVAINMLLQLCSAWVLAYAGIIFLAFGGSTWTRDIAINYFKTVIAVGASLMTMMLVIGIGTSIINDLFQEMSFFVNLSEVAIMLIASLTLLLLAEKLPAVVAGVITGASIGQASGTGSFGAGTAMGLGMTGGSLASKAFSPMSAVQNAAKMANGTGLPSGKLSQGTSLLGNSPFFKRR